MMSEPRRSQMFTLIAFGSSLVSLGAFGLTLSKLVRVSGEAVLSTAVVSLVATGLMSFVSRYEQLSRGWRWLYTSVLVASVLLLVSVVFVISSTRPV